MERAGSRDGGRAGDELVTGHLAAAFLSFCGGGGVFVLFHWGALLSARLRLAGRAPCTVSALPVPGTPQQRCPEPLPGGTHEHRARVSPEHPQVWPRNEAREWGASTSLESQGIWGFVWGPCLGARGHSRWCSGPAVRNVGDGTRLSRVQGGALPTVPSLRPGILTSVDLSKVTPARFQAFCFDFCVAILSNIQNT